MSTSDPAGQSSGEAAPPNIQTILPTEILRLIFRELNRPDLISCLTVSYFFYDLATFVIYNTLTIDAGKRDTFSATSERNRFNRLIRGGKSVPHTTLIPPSSIPFSSSAVGGDVDPLMSRFYHTTYLTIQSHLDCYDVPPPHMPKLRVLRILPQAGAAAGLDLCWTWPSKPCTCTILTYLRPPKVILGSRYTGVFGMASGLWGANGQSFPPPFVKELVLYVAAHPTQEETTFLSELPTTLGCFTLVIEPPLPPTSMRKLPDGTHTWKEEGLGKKISSVYDQMALPCSGEAKAVEVVGVEGIDPDWQGTGAAVEAAKWGIRADIKRRLVCRGVDEAEAGRRASAVKFITRREFNRRDIAEQLSLMGIQPVHNPFGFAR